VKGPSVQEGAEGFGECLKAHAERTPRSHTNHWHLESDICLQAAHGALLLLEIEGKNKNEEMAVHSYLQLWETDKD